MLAFEVSSSHQILSLVSIAYFASDRVLEIPNKSSGKAAQKQEVQEYRRRFRSGLLMVPLVMASILYFGFVDGVLRYTIFALEIYSSA